MLRWILSVPASGSDRPLDLNQLVWRNRTTVGQELARVVEKDDAVAQQAPPLLGVEGDGAGRATVRAVSGRTWGPMWTHCSPLRIADVLDGGPLVSEEPDHQDDW